MAQDQHGMVMPNHRVAVVVMWARVGHFAAAFELVTASIGLLPLRHAKLTQLHDQVMKCVDQRAWMGRWVRDQYKPTKSWTKTRLRLQWDARFPKLQLIEQLLVVGRLFLISGSYFVIENRFGYKRRGGKSLERFLTKTKYDQNFISQRYSVSTFHQFYFAFILVLTLVLKVY